MSHVVPGVALSARIESPSPRYRKARWALSAALTRRAAVITGRTDLVVTTVTEPGAPGVYYPDRAAIEIRAALFEKPPKGGRRTPAPATPTARPVGFGVFVHETAHAVHSRWRCPDGTGPSQAEAALLLEEIRIEAAQLRRRPTDRHWLRHSAKALILTDTAVASALASAWNAAHALALVSGRVDAGVLDAHEAAPVVTAATSQLGDELAAKLRELWNRVLGIGDDDVAEMLRAAAEWCALLGVDPGGPKPDEQQGPASAAQLKALATLTRAVKGSLARLAAHVDSESAPTEHEQRQPETDEFLASPAGRRDSDSGPVIGHRVPTAWESRQAAILAQRLGNAGMRERVSVTVASALPPGRLAMRAVLVRDAQTAAGAVPTAEPWQRTVRRTTPSPPLRVGIAADVSGSMKDFTSATSSIAWVLAQATRHGALDATSATVAFGGATVTPVTRPGRVSAHVTEFAATAVGHPVADAIDQLDRALGLARRGAARLLVIVSDGHFGRHERAAAQIRIDHLRATGCGVLWIAMAHQAPQPLAGAELALITGPTALGTVIGNAAVKTLTA